MTGTLELVRIALRRDRVRLPVWIVVIAAMVLLVAVTFEDLYPTAPEREVIGATVGANPALKAVLGPVFDASTIGGLVAWRMSFASLVLVPLLGALTVVRHTRAEEEAGRLELLGSTVMGRHAPLAAALLVAGGASLAVGVGVAAVLAGLGEDPAGSVALGAQYAAAGWLFAGVAAVAAQLTDAGRSASGIAAAVLGASFLLRSVADASASTALNRLTWASPLGWVLEVRPFADERWWVLGLLVGVAAVLVAAAVGLLVRRDLGAGLVPPRRGDVVADPSLSGPFGLAWRLHRGTVLAWTIGLFALGAMYGGVASGVGDLVMQTPELEEIFRLIGGEEALIDAFLSTTVVIAALLASGFVAAAVLRLRAEEVGLRAEHVLATAVGRVRWALSHTVVAAAGGALLLAASALGTGLVHGVRIADVGAAVPQMVGAALVQLPAVLVLGGLALAVFGVAPQAAPVVWAALVAFLVLGQLGALLQLDQWVMNLSPFTHVPALPGEPLRVLPLVALTGVAVALSAVGLVGLRRRDLG